MKRNKFSLSHYKLSTFNMGQLIPLTWYEALPGDSIQAQASVLVRLTPILAPLMHPVRVRINTFFVPNRLIWEDWEDYITGGSDGDDASVHPFHSVSAITEGSLMDYLGVPVASYSPNLTYSVLPIRAYDLIYNEYFRDQDLVTELDVRTTSGQDSNTPANIQKVSWEKDFFTTSRPWEQKGTAINIPLGTTAPITGIGKSNQTYGASPGTIYETDKTATTSYAGAADTDTTTLYVEEDPDKAGYPGIYADLAAATGISVNDLRLYLALQRYKENMAEGGSRYVEYLAHRWGVKSSDARLNLPEYVSGGRQTISFSEILATADSGTDVIGTMRGHGIAAMRTKKSRKFYEEHGIVMTLISIVPKSIYATGLDRSFSRTEKEDYFTKELQLIGDRAVLNKEVYTEHTTPDGTFGYQQRYDEYRSRPSGIAGEFRSSLNHWHYARIFGADPSLNQAFIECDPTARQYADNSSDTFYVMSNHSIQARRQISKFPKKRII